jgi:hypothetical protein
MFRQHAIISILLIILIGALLIQSINVFRTLIPFYGFHLEFLYSLGIILILALCLLIRNRWTWISILIISLCCFSSTVYYLFNHAYSGIPEAHIFFDLVKYLFGSICKKIGGLSAIIHLTFYIALVTIILTLKKEWVLGRSPK